MKNYTCSNCSSSVFFASVSCLNCGSVVGFNPSMLAMIAVEPVGSGSKAFRALKDESQPLLRRCANAAHDACNWLVKDAQSEPFCDACVLNDVIPNLREAGNLAAWREFELAKKRLMYSILQFGLPVDATDLGKGRLTFNFVRGEMTGHLDGVITVNVKEADSVERERLRQHFEEPYRSLLGHLRHESGHFYWNVLIEVTHNIEEFRSLLGDEQLNYSKALARHHADGPPEGWEDRFVSAYASAHPWEDWAETWAHYIHMVDAVETANVEGIEPRAAGIGFGIKWPFKKYDAYRTDSFRSLQERWIPLTIALNRLNRSMGHNDFYAFATPAAAYEKLEFIHRCIREHSRFAG